MDHETKLNQKLIEAHEVHQKHCQLCGDGEVCATGKALKEDAYPQNDSVGEVKGFVISSTAYDGYKVSIPNYMGGVVVRWSDYSVLLAERDELKAIVSDPKKWMRWCDIRVLEANEQLTAERDSLRAVVVELRKSLQHALWTKHDIRTCACVGCEDARAALGEQAVAKNSG